MASRTVDATESSSIDKPITSPETLSRRPRRLLASLVIAMAFCLIGAAALSDVATNFGDFAKVLGVFAFIISMTTLAVSMVADAYRS